MPEDKMLNISLKNYPNIQKYLEETKGDTTPLVKHLSLLDSILANGDHKRAISELGISIHDILRETYEAHFDYKGITQFANNEAEAQLLAVLELENNPLSTLKGKRPPRDLEGNPIELGEFLGGNVSFKRHIQKMLYSMKYLNHTDYVNYLMLGQYDLMQIERNKHIDQIIQIKPALAFQKNQGLPVGMFIEGTGFFDCGEMDLNSLSFCPACTFASGWKKFKDIGYCADCKAAVKHKYT